MASPSPDGPDADRSPEPRTARSDLWRLALPLAAALTLGLAPFFPEPHLVGKIRWIAGGAVGMGGMDWFDTVLHGSPWVWLAVELVRVVVARFRRQGGR